MRLTNRTIAKLPVPARGNRISYDDEIGGFGCRVTAAGNRAFVLNYYRRADGRERRITIGGFPEWSAAAAREEAKRLKREIDGGADPVGAYQESRAAPTMADLCTRFLADYVPRKRPSTQRSYRHQIRADILPAIGRAKVAAVTHADVDAFHHRLSVRVPTHANRMIAVLSKMFSLSVRWGWRIDNPCKGIERNEEAKATPIPNRRRAQATDQGVRQIRGRERSQCVRLLLLTGADAANSWPPSGPTSTWKPAYGSNRAQPPSRRRRTASRYPRRRAGCLPKCGRKRTMMRNGFFLPVAVGIARTSTRPGMSCARPPVFLTRTCMI